MFGYRRPPDPPSPSAVVVQRYRDLVAHPELILWSGHVESNGIVAIMRSAAAAEAGTPMRVQADRAAHPDDERFIFSGRNAEARGVTS